MFIYEVDDDYNDADGDVNAMAMIMQLFTYWDGRFFLLG